MSFIKYRIGEMAKDFGVPTKNITNLVTEFFEKPKSAQQVLTEQQLNVLFDVMTQRNQIDSIEQVFATAQPAEAALAPAASEAPKAEEPKAEAPKPQQTAPKAAEPKQAPKAEAKPAAKKAAAPKAEAKPAAKKADAKK